MKFRATIPNDYHSEADSRVLALWCEAHGIACDEAAIFEAAESVWPGAEVVEVGDFHRIFEAPAAPPIDSEDWPPLWTEAEQQAVCDT